MFDFTQGAKKKRVQAVFTNRMNHSCFEELQGNDRGPDRSPFVRVLAIVPSINQKWAFDQAFPAVSRDICPDGMAVIHDGPLEEEVLVEIPHDGGVTFVRCEVQHCSNLGYGFHHIGLQGRDTVTVEVKQRNELDERMSQFETTEASA